MNGERPASGHEHVKALDGIRGLAILWVMLFHMGMVAEVGSIARAWRAFTLAGTLGVDVFFALSGFLITGILLRSKGQPHYFRNFYARRVLRIFPLYYAVVFFSLIVLPHLTHSVDAKTAVIERDSIWYWLHLSNFAIARRGAFVHGILDVSWSLSIEEQFYLVWPLLVRFTSERRLYAIAASLVVVSWGSRIGLTLHGASPVAIYALTWCRLDALAIGAATALLVRRHSAVELRAWLGPASWGAFAFALSMVALSISNSLRWVNLTLTSTSVALATSSLIVGSLVRGEGWLARTLAARPLTLLGRFSYCMYFVHYPVSAVLRDVLLRRVSVPLVLGSSLPAQWCFDALAIGATLAVAWLSWHLYEKHFLRLKRYFPSARPVVD